MPTGLFIDAATGTETERELTPDEIAAITETDADRIARLNGEAQTNRRGAFQAEADPIYFAWQRGEAPEQAWLDKCAEIRARYPYVEAT
jgi:hypothetical protein